MEGGGEECEGGGREVKEGRRGGGEDVEDGYREGDILIEGCASVDR